MQDQWWKGTETETGVDIQCQLETPHPDTVFQIQGLEIVLQDKERKQEMEEMEASEKHGKKIDFSYQKEHLKSMEQLINIISPSTTQNSFLPAGYNGIEIIALTGAAAILLVIRCGECLWLRKGNKELVKRSSELVNQLIGKYCVFFPFYSTIRTTNIILWSEKYLYNGN